MPSLLEERISYKPLEYPYANDLYIENETSHWKHWEVSMQRDVFDWRHNLKDIDRAVIGGVLRGFTQAELIIGEYWAEFVATWFKKPEIVMLARALGARENTHIAGYSYLSDTLGIDEYEEFLKDPAAQAKLAYLINTKATDLPSIALSLAVFSAFAEGVALFSSFAILTFFGQCNLLKDVSKIVEWSAKDEALHSKAGCWLFNQLCSENPGLREEVKSQVEEAAEAVVQLEHKFIDSVFSQGEIFHKGVNGETLNSTDLKEYIKRRANLKLNEIQLASKFEVDNEAADRVAVWFEDLIYGKSQQDFFASIAAEYSLGSTQFDADDLDFTFEL